MNLRMKDEKEEGGGEEGGDGGEDGVKVKRRKSEEF